MKKGLILFFLVIAGSSLFSITQIHAKEIADNFQAAQNAYKVYKSTSNKDSLSTAYANIQLSIGENPLDYKRYLLAGLILNNMKNNKVAPQLAIQNFDKAIELNPKDGVLYYSIAQELNNSQKSVLSLGYYEKALITDKGLISAQFITVLADTYIKTGQNTGGICFFKNYIENNPDTPAYFILTTAYLMEIETQNNQAKEYLKLVINNNKYSETDQQRAKEMLEVMEE